MSFLRQREKNKRAGRNNNGFVKLFFKTCNRNFYSYFIGRSRLNGQVHCQRGKEAPSSTGKHCKSGAVGGDQQQMCIESKHNDLKWLCDLVQSSMLVTNIYLPLLLSKMLYLTSSSQKTLQNPIQWWQQTSSPGFHNNLYTSVVPLDMEASNQPSPYAQHSTLEHRQSLPLKLSR